MPDLMEDIIRRCADDERSHGPSYFSLSPLYVFLSDAVLIAKGQERQAIIDALPTREAGHSDDWNEGFDAALGAIFRILVGRSMMP